MGRTVIDALNKIIFETIIWSYLASGHPPIILLNKKAHRYMNEIAKYCLVSHYFLESNLKSLMLNVQKFLFFLSRTILILLIAFYRMTRHGLNCTNSAVYSYAERKKDQKAAGYGAERMRLGKDAVKGFDCCSLTLQPTSRPVITPQGWIFDKVYYNKPTIILICSP